METSLEFYKSKYEEFSNVMEKAKEREQLINSNKMKIEELESKISQQATKILKYKERVSKVKEKYIDLELEVSKKNTEIDLLKLQNSDLSQTIMKLEVSLNEKTKILFDVKNADSHENIPQINLKSDLLDTMKEENFQNLENPIKRDLDISKPNKSEQDEKSDDMEIIKKENQLLMEKCKKLYIENENNKAYISKVELSMQNTQKEKNELSLKLRYSLENSNPSSDVGNINSSVNINYKILNNIFPKDDFLKQILVKETRINELFEENERLSQELNVLFFISMIAIFFIKELKFIKSEYENLKFESNLVTNQKNSEMELLLSCFYDVVSKFKAYEELERKKQTKLSSKRYLK